MFTVDVKQQHNNNNKLGVDLKGIICMRVNSFLTGLDPCSKGNRKVKRVLVSPENIASHLKAKTYERMFTSIIADLGKRDSLLIYQSPLHF